MDGEEFDEQEYAKQVKGPLPFVTPATMASLSADKDKGYLLNAKSVDEWLARFTRENPALKGYLDGYLSGVDSSIGAHVLWVVIGVYELLRRQAESDLLKERFGKSG